MTKNFMYIYNMDSFENSIQVENYPWGFRLKTKKRYWLETNKKGTRLISCTLNPKTNAWCKPKKSTYYKAGVLTTDFRGEQLFVSWRVLSDFSTDHDIKNFENEINIKKLPVEMQKNICALKAKNFAWKDLKVEFVCNPTPEQAKELEEKDAKAKNYLLHQANKAYKTCLKKNNLN